MSSLALVVGLAAPAGGQEPGGEEAGGGGLLPDLGVDELLDEVEVFDPAEVVEAVAPDVSGLHLDDVVNEITGERVGEVVEARTLTSKTFQLVDGGFETEIFTSDVHYPDADGRLVELDTTLELVDGLLGEVFAAVDLPFEVALPLTAAGATTGHGVSSTLRGASLLAVGLPDDDGHRVTYADALPGVDVVAWATTDGIAEDLVIESLDAAGQELVGYRRRHCVGGCRGEHGVLHRRRHGRAVGAVAGAVHG